MRNRKDTIDHVQNFVLLLEFERSTGEFMLPDTREFADPS